MTTVEEQFEPSSDTLCEVIVVFRHGHRAPIMFSPDDPNKCFWPNGAGNLTNTGKEDGYLIGTFIRNRYPNFIDEKYKSEEIYVRSTDVDRNLMTAQCCLAALYPPTGEEVWKTGLSWQPIPVHTALFGSDSLIPEFSKTITRPPNGFADNEANAAYNVISKYNFVIDEIGKDFKIGVGNIGIALLLLDTYLMELDAGLPAYLPPTLELIGPQELRDLANNIYLLTCKTGKCIISAAHLFKNILKQISQKVSGEMPKRKAFFYCMHDITISACLEAFNCSRKTKFGGVLLFELHKRPDTNDYFVKVFFKSSIRDEAEPEVISINGSSIGSLADFETIVKNYVCDNGNDTC